jgi:hypothetical protein
MAEQILNKKWKSLAKRVAPLIKPKKLTPNNVFSSFKDICRTQDAYFRPLFNNDKMGIIKTTYYIYSLLKTSNFDLGDDIINNLFFASVLETENETYSESCDNCSGDGYVECSECDGRGEFKCSNCNGGGEEECGTCDGTGNMECDDCDGSGVDEEGDQCISCDGTGELNCNNCNGKGEVTCEECDGTGSVSCDECGSDTSVTCNSCYGSGDVETDEIKYITYDICTSNKDIFNLCELNSNTEKPITTNETYLDFWNEIISLGRKEKHGDVEFELENEQIYCYFFTTEPRLYTKADFSLGLYEEDEYFYFNT